MQCGVQIHEKDGYIVSLDSLRAIAILLVMLHHWLPKSFIVKQYVPLGALGVQMFLFQSGLLITRKLLHYREGILSGKAGLRDSAYKFLGERLLKISPSYFIILLVAYLLNDPFQARTTMTWHAFFLSNVGFAVRDTMQNDMGYLWMLSVVVQFYILWPLVVFLVPVHVLPRVIIVTLVLSLVYKVVVLRYYANWYAAMHQLVSCLDTLCLGAFLSYALYADQWRIVEFLQSKLFLLIGSVLSIVIMVVFSHTDFSADGNILRVIYGALNYIAFAMICCWIVAWCYAGMPSIVERILGLTVFVYLGSISYGLYLSHPYAAILMDKLNYVIGLTPNVTLRIFQYLVMAVCCASVMYYLIERPVSGLRKRVFR